MLSQLTAGEEALRLFFTEDIYLVHEPEAAAAPEIPAQNHVAVPQFKSLGNNKRHILILVNDAQNDVSDENGRELLRKIVKSVNLTANDFALVNYANHNGSSFDQFNQYFSPVVVFSFGVTAEQLGLGGMPQNTIFSQGAVRFVFSAELKALDQDQHAKKVLWGSLKLLEL